MKQRQRLQTETDPEKLRIVALSLIEDIERLQQENEVLRALVAELEDRLRQRPDAKLSAQVELLREQLRLKDRQLYGAKSEQRPLGPVTEAPSAPRKGHGPTAQPELARVTLTHELPPESRHCPQCNGELELLGDQAEEAERIHVIERRFVLETHRRLKYRCRCNGHVSTAPGPRTLVPGGRYSPAFALEVALDKYLYHLPLERQVHRMRQQGLYVTPQTLWDQLAALGEALRPTYEAIRRTILESPVVLADETTWRVNESGRIDPKRSWYVWAAANDTLVHYRIDDNRGAEAARALLSGYRGTVMSDGYAVYAKLAQQEGLTTAHCWAHVRRKFVEAEANFPTEAGEAIARIRALYAIEERATGLGPDARRKMRQAEAKPLVEDFFTWLDTLKALPQSGLGKAIAYAKQLREGLSVYLDDAAVPIDNNACERALRGIVVGRKNVTVHAA